VAREGGNAALAQLLQLRCVVILHPLCSEASYLVSCVGLILVVILEQKILSGCRSEKVEKSEFPHWFATDEQRQKARLEWKQLA
jgi:hypothetical protein